MPFRERGTAIPDASAGGGDLAAMFSRRGCGGMDGKHVVRFLTSATRMASEDEPMVCRMMLLVGLTARSARCLTRLGGGRIRRIGPASGCPDAG